MPTALRERPRTDAPVVLVERRRPRRLLAAALAGAAVVAVGVPAVRGLDLLPHLSNPLSPQTVDRTGPALLQSITELHDYHAARGTFSVVVDLEKDTPYVPAVVSGERTTYVAQGSADAVVDLSTLGADAVRADGTSATITLPRPTLTGAVVDPQQSRVVGRDRGIAQRLAGVAQDSPTSEREVQAVAVQRLDDAARASDLQRRGEDATRAMLIGLGQAFGYGTVTVEFTDPPV